ncbi:MAG TPA: SpoIID/LytB domain-containing protein [Limnochordales bacterium]|nr:SpoIID/LytB domain-containing protein [Limnochordales bacterium]
MDSARLRSMTIVAVILLLALGALFLVSGRSGAPDQARGEEPTITLVHRDGRREQMPMEQYVKGVVAGEMGRLPPRGETEEQDWPEEAYAAQAILARSFAVRYLEESGGSEIPAQHEAAQAYNPGNITPAIERGVDRTRGEVMTYQGETVRAWFHSYSGGRTATAREGLAQEEDPPYIKSVDTGENEFAPEDVVSWQVSLGLDEIGAALRDADVDVGEVRDVRIAARGPSRRVTEFEIVGSQGTRTVSGNDFRLAVGPERLKSTLIDELDVRGGRLIATGRGFGHGVGLSQWDAYKLAREGRSPEEIVTFFFEGIEIQRRW